MRIDSTRDGHRATCDDCGAASPTYARRVDALAVARFHLCEHTCPGCGWRRRQAGEHRGLCWRCYRSEVRHDYPTRIWRADDLLDEWDLLRREGHTVRQAAERLGVTYAALDKALCRAKRAGDPRAARTAAAAYALTKEGA